MTAVWLTLLNGFWFLGWSSGWVSGEVINNGSFYGDKRLIDRTTKPMGKTGAKAAAKEGPAKKLKGRAKKATKEE